MGKLALYSACAGINPSNTLPVVIDVGTNNTHKLKDPLYMGLKQNRISAKEEKEFIAEFMVATAKRWPGMVVQFEDVRWLRVAFKARTLWQEADLVFQCYATQFSTEMAFDLLDQHRGDYSAFNDDIQGTAAVSLAGFINAVRQSGTPFDQQKIVFFGAGSAAVGIAKLVSGIKSTPYLVILNSACRRSANIS